MATVSVQARVPGPRSSAEALFYDLDRWPAFVEGFGSVLKLEGDWPGAGARLVWASRPGGRGRVVEEVLAQRGGEGQRIALEDEKLRGTQTVSFEAMGDDVRVTLAWEYELKDVRFPVSLFVRRALADSLRRTLARYRIERLSDVDDERSAPPIA